MAKHLPAQTLSPSAPALLAAVVGLIFGSGVDACELIPLFELAALLLVPLDNPSQQQGLAALYEPLLTSMQSLLQTDASSAVSAIGDQLARNVACCAAVAKGLSKPHLEDQHKRALHASVACLGALPSHPALRNRCCTLVHVAVVSACSAETVVEVLPVVLGIFFTAFVDEDDVTGVMQLVCNLCVHYSARLTSVFEATPLFSFLDHLAAAALAPPDGITSRAVYQRALFSILLHLSTHVCDAITRNAEALPRIYHYLAAGVSGIDDILIKKQCLITVACILKSKGLDCTMLSFLCENFVPSVIGCLLLPQFRTQDANCSRFLTEVSAFLYDLSRSAGPDFRQYFCEQALPGLGFPLGLCTEIALCFSESDSTALERKLRGSIARPE